MCVRTTDRGPIPAHLLGNMWAQDWGALYPELEPYKGQGELDVGKALKQQHYDEVRMVKLGESFFTSLGLPPLPETFWQRSMLQKPKDREVVCHASAWDVHYNGDLRIKMCIKVNHDDLLTIHHELGHIFYFQQYDTLPMLFQDGANDGFHEAIGDAIALSVTPSYLRDAGLLQRVPVGDKGAINQLMQRALAKIAFLPFDPGAKYHVAANVPYARYFLATVLQYQFYRALCKHAGHQGPLHTCSIFGNKVAGEKLRQMLALGAEKPWPETLEVLTGQRDLDATAILDYFAPLTAWLGKQNEGRTCGW